MTGSADAVSTTEAVAFFESGAGLGGSGFMIYPWYHCTLVPPFFGVHSDAAAVGDVSDFPLNWQACFQGRK
jgi:hypothetical protein